MEEKASEGGVHVHKKRKLESKKATVQPQFAQLKQEKHERLNYVKFNSEGHVLGDKGQEKIEAVYHKVHEQAPWLLMDDTHLQKTNISIRFSWLWSVFCLLLLVEDQTPQTVAAMLWKFIKYITVQIPGFTVLYFIETNTKVTNTPLIYIFFIILLGCSSYSTGNSTHSTLCFD